MDGMNAIGRSFDHAVATFVADTEARGLDDKIMLMHCWVKQNGTWRLVAHQTTKIEKLP